MPATSTTLAILAGGEGSRMGKPKSLLTIGGRPILDYLFDRFTWPGPTLLVTAPGNEHPPGHERFAREATDPVAGEGPLRGLLTALDACDTPMLAVTTVDMPLVSAAHLLFLMSSLETIPDCLGLMLRRKLEGKSQIEPFPSVCRAQARGAVAKELLAGRRSIHALSYQSEFSTLDAPPDWSPDTWLNLNHPQDVIGFSNRSLP